MQTKRRIVSLVAALFVVTLTGGCSGNDDGDDLNPAVLNALLGAVTNPLDARLLAAAADANVSTPTIQQNESAEMIALGKALFFDKILSGDQNISCATCHHPSASTGDDLPTSIGAGGSGTGAARELSGSAAMIARNAPALFNLGASEFNRAFWDGRVSLSGGVLTTPEAALNGASPARSDITAQLTSVLAAQAMFPVTSDDEMRGQPGNDIRDAADNEAAWAAIMARLVGTSNGSVGGIAEYRSLFHSAFPEVTDYDDFNFGHAARAIAAFEVDTYTSTTTLFDQFLAGNTFAMTNDQKAGGLLFFGRGGCGDCHEGPLLSDFDFHGIAAPQLGPGKSGGDDMGRFHETGNNGDRYEFRTPPLRNIELTAPYTHAGAYTSLAAVVAHYNDTDAGIRNYDAAQLGRDDYIATVDTDAGRIQDRINARDRLVRPNLGLNANEQAQLVAFLQSLTDPAMLDLTGEIPASVPGGLPVD